MEKERLNQERSKLQVFILVCKVTSDIFGLEEGNNLNKKNFTLGSTCPSFSFWVTYYF